MSAQPKPYQCDMKDKPVLATISLTPFKHTNGYMISRISKDHPFASMADKNGRVYTHRLIAAALLGRPLLKSELVHHLDENRANNSPENLEIMTFQQHKFIHRLAGRKQLRAPGESNPEIQCLCGCGNLLLKYDKEGRARECVAGHQQKVWRMIRRIGRVGRRTS